MADLAVTLNLLILKDGVFDRIVFPAVCFHRPLPHGWTYRSLTNSVMGPFQQHSAHTPVPNSHLPQGGK